MKVLTPYSHDNIVLEFEILQNNYNNSPEISQQLASNGYCKYFTKFIENDKMMLRWQL